MISAFFAKMSRTYKNWRNFGIDLEMYEQY